MRILLQRVSQARVEVEAKIVGAIDEGLLAFVGLTHEDSEQELEALAKKMVHLRIFEDDAGKLNHSLLDIGGAALLVSQFTLYADTRKGRRPSFGHAMRPNQASPLFDRFVEIVKSYGVQVETGIFGAEMDVHLCNQGPITIWLDTEQ